MSKHDDRVYLQHVLDCIEHVHGFTGNSLHIFHEVPEKWFATLRVLQTMSESAMKLSDKTKAVMPEIEWNRIKGFRNILVHDYLGDIDHTIVRKVIEIELPKLEKEAKHMLKILGEK